MLKDNIELVSMDKTGIKASSSVTTYSSWGPEHILDDDESTYFHSNTYSSGGFGDVYFEFPAERVINRIDFLTRHPFQLNGVIFQYEILYKNKTTSPDWKTIFVSETASAAGVRSSEFDSIIVSNLCIRVHNSYGRWILMNTIDFYIDTEMESEILNIFTDFSCKHIKNDITLKNIVEFKNENLKPLAKLLWLNDNNVKIEQFQISKNTLNLNEYRNTLKINTMPELKPLRFRFEKKTQYIIMADRDIELVLINNLEELDNFELQEKIDLKSGINSIYLNRSEGEVFVKSRFSEDVTIYLYNPTKTKYYSLGRHDFREIFSKNDIESTIFIEGNHFMTELNTKDIKDNFNAFTFVDLIQNLDRVISKVYFLLNRNSYTDATPFKMIISNSILDGLNRDLIKEIVDRIIPSIYFTQEVKDLLKFILFKELEYVYLEEFEFSSDLKRDIWLKVRLFLNDDRLLARLYKNIQKVGFNESENELEKIIYWVIEILERDISKYFIEAGYNLSSDCLEKCNEYPEITIDLNEITFENREELIATDLENINIQYKDKIGG